MGADQWNKLHLWKHPEILSSHVHFIVCDRENAELMDQGFEKDFVSSNHPASSTKIRNDLKLKIKPKWLNLNTLEYINTNLIYHM